MNERLDEIEKQKIKNQILADKRLWHRKKVKLPVVKHKLQNSELPTSNNQMLQAVAEQIN